MKFRNDGDGPVDAFSDDGPVTVPVGGHLEASGDLGEGYKSQPDRWTHIPDPKRVRAGKKAAAAAAADDTEKES